MEMLSSKFISILQIIFGQINYKFITSYNSIPVQVHFLYHFHDFFIVWKFLIL